MAAGSESPKRSRSAADAYVLLGGHQLRATDREAECAKLDEQDQIAAADDTAVDLATEIEQADVVAEGGGCRQNVLGGLGTQPADGRKGHTNAADGAAAPLL